MKQYTVFLLLLLSCMYSVAQDPAGRNADSLRIGTLQDIEIADTVVAIPDSIEIDTTIVIVRTWVLSEDFSLEKDILLDTTKTGLQVYNPVYKNSIINSYLGNIGLPVKNNLLYWNEKKINYLFLQPFSPYLYTHDNNIYFNVRKPYTVLGFTSAVTTKEKREEIFQALHTQNVTPFFNFGAGIKIGTSEGQYSNQASKRSHFRGWSSYSKGDYSMHSSLIRNTFRNTENGGIENDSLFRLTRGDERTYSVNLIDANSELKNTDLQVTQRYRFGKETEVEDTSSATGFSRLRERTTKTGSFIHTMRYDRNWRTYQDGFGPQSFYRNFYADSLESHDSTFYLSFSNTVQVMLDENPYRSTDFGARAFATYELEKYAFSHQYRDTTTTGDDTLAYTPSAVSKNYNNISVGASLVHTVGGGWNWIFKGKTHLGGYRIGDLLLSGEITKFIRTNEDPSHIKLAGRFSLTEPDYFYQHFSSNHFRWENDFSKVKELLATLDYSNPRLLLDVRAYYSVLTDYLYIDTDTMPAQFDKGLLLLGGVANKKLIFGAFHSYHTLAYQFASNRFVVRIPDIAYYTSNFFDFALVKDVLFLQIGFDLYYNTLFSGYSFMPATGFFYNQDVQQLGNYPYLDLFLTARLKRTMAFFKIEHPYAQTIKKNYFHVLDYPMTGMVIKFGLSWTFYD